MILRYKYTFFKINNENKKFACIAPAVSDKYQYAGIGSKLVEFTIRILKEKLYEMYQNGRLAVKK